MLKSIKINNFRWLAWNIEINLKIDKRTHKQSDDHSFVSFSERENISKLLCIYWPNAIWKTSILEAIFLVKNIILGNFQIFMNFNISKHKFFIDRPIEFELIFWYKSKLFKYQLKLDHKDLKWVVTYEKLTKIENKKQNVLFVRSGKNIKISWMSSDQIKKLNIHPQISLIASCYLFLKDITEVYEYFQKISLLEPLNIFKWYWSPHYTLLPKWLEIIFSNQNLKKKLIDYFKKADLTITDIIIEKVLLPWKGQRYTLNFKHNINWKEFDLNISEESSGTLEFLWYLSYFLYLQINWGGVILIDELDSHLHPYLLNNLIKLVISEVNKNIQVIFTTHDISILYEKSLAKDQIWFIDRKEDSKLDEKIFYKLSDFGGQIRDEYDWLKMYMLGNVGAVPFLKD